MKIAYRRVSATDQNLDRQEFADADEIFEERASGADTERPELARMIAFARKGDEVVVHSLDRLARDLRDLCQIVETLNNKGVSVTFRAENLTFRPGADDPLARLQLHMMGAFAEFERQLIKRRQREGIAKAKARGVYKGRRPTIDPREVARLRDEGVGPAEIARQMGIGRASVYRVLNASEGR